MIVIIIIIVITRTKASDLVGKSFPLAGGDLLQLTRIFKNHHTARISTL